VNERRAMGCTGERSTAAGGLLRRSVAFSTALTLPADLALRSTWLARPTMLKRLRTRRLTGLQPLASALLPSRLPMMQVPVGHRVSRCRQRVPAEACASAGRFRLAGQPRGI
jgi:hypothetical protein